MAAFRERYSARHGMGHADRPRRHHALGLDAQSRRVRLPAARGRRHSYSHSNTHTYPDTHCDTNFNTNTESYADAEAASYASPATLEMVISDL